jgi:AraC family transcriptional regulator, alkane utilization regulator
MLCRNAPGLDAAIAFLKRSGPSRRLFGPPMDVLSEVLRVVRLSGAIHFCGEFTQPWAFLSTEPQMMAARLKLPEGSVTQFHICVDGSCWVTPGALAPLRIDAGDVVIFPRGDQYVMGSDLDVAPVPIGEIYPQPMTDRVTKLRHGGGGTLTRFICGYLQSDQQFDPLLHSLPSVLRVRNRQGELILETLDQAGHRTQPIENAGEAEWWQASVRFLTSETMQSGPGNRAVLARLAEALFVEVLRWQFRYSAQGQGWLAGLADPQIGRVLSLLHALPNRPWTVNELAAEVTMSRAVLAKRFVALVGQSPIQYLAGWRMHLARHLLQKSAFAIGEIAERVGYESEAAFSRAFRRSVGVPPAAWRQNHSQRESA